MSVGPNSKSATPLKHHHNRDNKSLGNGLLERWMANKPWEIPMSNRKSEELVPIFQTKRSGMTTRISSFKICQQTPSSSTINSEYMNNDSVISSSCTSGSPSIMPFSNTTVMAEAREEKDVPSYMSLTESTKAKLKALRSSSQNSKRLTMDDCLSHNTNSTFLNGYNSISSSGSDPSVNIWKDYCAALVPGRFCLTPEILLIVIGSCRREFSTLLSITCNRALSEVSLGNLRSLLSARNPLIFNAFQLDPLDHDPTMALFHHFAQLNHDSSYMPDKNLVREIVKGCKGSPLVLQVIPGSLCQQPFEKCLDILEDINQKEYFMDMGLFPEDQRIPVTIL
ncbi:hypothetical protein KIW84_023076 [Lathyrus oleraceus]|uniref:Uncharacterized protein n=1 Tax=Pisum sativum TaxID=3888 RepID=A0A9D4YHY3_PEA|nr:hypothetical protein KIW84_023076 [Pisum sativum]